MNEHEDDGPQLPEGFEEVEATVCRRGEELIVFGTLEEGQLVLARTREGTTDTSVALVLQAEPPTTDDERADLSDRCRR